MEEMKKDYKSIIIYFGTQVLLALMIGLVIGAMGRANNYSDIVNFIPQIVCFIIFAFMYYKMIVKDVKKLNVKSVLITIGIGILLVLFNDGITHLLRNVDVPMNNQDMIENMFYNYKFLVGIIVSIFAPVTEELVFRYSIGTIIKNKWIFLIVSSVIFGLMHGIGLITFLYIFIGLILGLAYLKSDKNIAVPMIIHIINNLAAVIMMLI